LPDEQVVLCIEVFGRNRLQVHRADPDAACERLTKLLPQIVVIAEDLAAEIREMIDDRAVAVGAVIVVLPKDSDFATIERLLEQSVDAARAARGKKPRSA
jgi:vacuolar-type H+-ATPase subunit F/Vma7